MPHDTGRPARASTHSAMIARSLCALLIAVIASGCSSGASRAVTTGTPTATPAPSGTTTPTLAPTPTLAQLSLYVGLCDPSAGGSVEALRATDGTVRWKSAKVGKTCASIADAEADGTIFASGDAVYALNAANGSILWTHPFAADSQIGQLAYADGSVFAYIITPDMAMIYALAAKDGSVRWHYQVRRGLGGANFLTSNGVVYGSSLDLSGPGQVFLFALNAATGAELWRQPIDRLVQVDSSADGFVYGHTNVFFQNENPPPHFIRSFSAANGTQQWSQKTLENPGQVGIDTDTVFVGSELPQTTTAHISAFGRADGSLRWRVAVCNIGLYAARPVIAAGTLYYGCQDNSISASAVTDGAVLWRRQTDGNASGAMVLSNGRLFAVSVSPTTKSLYALNATDGSVVWHTPITNFPSSLVVGL